MKNRDLGLEILQGIKEIKDFNKEKKTLKTREFKKVPPVHIIRKKLNLSQFNFANLIGISVRTIQDWEQGKRNPTGSAKSLLRITEQKPEIFTQTH
ncbi:transcriptional regulator, XRE family [Abyssogena phaseoliformis symbiont OG214]|uniref:helix-turn-helix domain-containing protein n=1 Tax=Abyssogena phaseoliformis symbiont TaxID=596095 RepID=UPI001915FA85|nr:helix-turn-helix domain-containing protein [Abyssogena phaseoliformis symbiont]BBB22306.1 transcriptional regulator, XRE family [Abyssogena phaseoliformis symbiont OG214]